MKNHNKSAMGYNSKRIRLAFNRGSKQDLNNTSGLIRTSEDIPVCFSKNSFPKTEEGLDVVLLCLYLVCAFGVRFALVQAR